MNYFNEIEDLIRTNEINKGVRTLQDNRETLYTYWHVGKIIVESQDESKKTNNLIKELGKRLSLKYGKEFNASYFSKMRLFYLTFPILKSLIPKLSWTHYLQILTIKNPNERNFYINKVILNNLSVRDLKKEIKNKTFDTLSYANKEHVKIVDAAYDVPMSINDINLDTIFKNI